MKAKDLDKNIQVLKIRRIALTIQYDGSNYSGWQKQPNTETIQEVLEKTISLIDPYRPIKVIAAGRTDAGVHAAGQVVHFDCSGPIPAKRWASALNGRLPNSIRVIDSTECPNTWHACFSAIARRYRYTIYNGCAPNLFLYPWTWHKFQYRLDENIMRNSLVELIGNHDFRAFQRAGSKRKDAFTTIKDVQVERMGDLVKIEIEASGFLYGMVRLIVGQLVALGEHKLNPNDFQKRWKDGKREEVKESAPAKGLCFLKAIYKDNFLAPKNTFTSFPDFLLERHDPPPSP